MKKRTFALRLFGLIALLSAILACSLAQNLLDSSLPATTPPPVVTSEALPGTELPKGPQVTEPPAPLATTEIPAETPAALQVVYVKDGNVWLWVEGASARALTASGNVVRVALSGDRAVVAFQRNVDDYHAELWAVNADGSGERLLVGVSDFDSFDPDKRLEYSLSLLPQRIAWVPGTHTLAYNTRQTFEGPGMGMFDDLRLVNADSGEKTTLLSAGQGGEFYYSPNGQSIAVVTPTMISLVNADGSNRRQVLDYPLVVTYSEYQYYAHPLWAKDSSLLRVAIPPAEALSQPPQPTTLWTIPMDGAPATQLASLVAAPFFGAEVALTPDLARMAYLREVGQPEENRRELHLANVDGSGDALYLEGKFLSFSTWAPDSAYFLFSYGEPLQYYLGADGGSSTPIPGGQDIQHLRWIDNERFVFTKSLNGLWELHLATASGATILIDNIPGDPPNFDF